jgi:cytochrome P450
MPQMNELTQELLVEPLHQSIQEGKSVNIEHLFQHLALSIVISTTVGMKKDKAAFILDRMFLLTQQLNNPLFLIPGWKHVPTPLNRRVEAAFLDMDKVIYEAIAERRRERAEMTPEQRQEQRTLLDMFIEARDETDGSYLTDIEVRTEHGSRIDLF